MEYFDTKIPANKGGVRFRNHFTISTSIFATKDSKEPGANEFLPNTNDLIQTMPGCSTQPAFDTVRTYSTPFTPSHQPWTITSPPASDVAGRHDRIGQAQQLVADIGEAHEAAFVVTTNLSNHLYTSVNAASPQHW